MSGPKIQILPLRRPAPPPVKPTQQLVLSSSSETSEDGLSVTKKRTRVGGPKVKTGCITCKIRRVKCDELKPSCERCTSTGRKCDGYAALTSKLPRLPHETRTVMVARSLDTKQGSSAERRALDFFQHRTAPKLASLFDQEVWQRLVIQIGMAEPAIRHAMITLGSLNESREKAIIASPMRRVLVLDDPLASNVPQFQVSHGQDDPFALVHYNKAIVQLAQRMHQVENATDIALLTCVLFVCIEMLRGDTEPALHHFRAGMAIAVAALKDKRKPAYTQMHTARKQLLPFFHRLEILAMLSGKESTWDYPVEAIEAVPETFQDLIQARESLVHLSNVSLRFIRSVRLSRYDNTLSPNSLQTQASLLHFLKLWLTTFKSYKTFQTLTPSALRSAHVLEIHYITTFTWLARACSADETSTDLYTADFSRAVSLAETLQATAAVLDPEPGFSTFHFDMEFVPHLYIIAAKCRDPQIRRRAIAVLRSGFRREGLWDSHVAAAVAERIMQREEAGLLAGEWPGESARIHNTLIQFGTGINPLVHGLTYYSKSGGLEAGWNTEQETLVMQPG